MMFGYSFHLADEAQAIEDAVDTVLAQGWRTADIAKAGRPPSAPRRWAAGSGRRCKGEKQVVTGAPPFYGAPVLHFIRNLSFKIFRFSAKERLHFCKSAAIIWHSVSFHPAGPTDRIQENGTRSPSKTQVILQASCFVRSC